MNLFEDMIDEIVEPTDLIHNMAINNFNREESKKYRKKYRKLDSWEKQNLYLYIKDKLNCVLAFKKIQKSISVQRRFIDNYEDLFDFFSKIDLVSLIKNAEKTDSYFPCVFINGNEAWISKSSNGHYRYFSKNKCLDTIGFDFIDLLELYYGETASQAIKKAIKDFRICFMEDSYMNEQNKKYLSNLTIIHNSKKHILKDYPELFEYIKGHLKLLETMNVLGNINIKKREFSYKNNNIFFASNSYIADFLGNYTISTTNKVLNIFAILGLIKKISKEDVPSQLLHESQAIAERRNLGNIISYYIVPSMIDILDTANKNAIIMNEHNIRYSNICKDRVVLAFGKEFADEIYVQEIQKNKIKNITPTEYIHRFLEENLIDLLNTQGYATKSMIYKIKIANSTEKQKQKELEKIWKSLIIKHKLEYLKPTQENKEKYKLINSEYIAIYKNMKEEEI
jgi:hypothetical protein